MLTHALALSASQYVRKKTSQPIYTSTRSEGLELTKLTYTRLEDNLIRHLGDRKVSLLEGESDLTPARRTPPTRYEPARACLAACLTEAAREREEYCCIGMW